MSIKQRLLAILITCFFFAIVKEGSAGELQKHRWELGPEISYIEYTEPGVMKDKGLMYGVAGSYTYHDNIMLKAEGRYSYGQVDYSSYGTGSMDNIDDHIFELRGLAGLDYPTLTGGFFTPYIGIGYRYLNDNSSGRVTSTGAWGYERESNYIYSPVGVNLSTLLENDWTFAVTAEYDIFWYGKQISHLSDVDGYNDLENRQKRGQGYRSSVRFEKRSFAIEPFIRSWRIEESEHEYFRCNGMICEGWEPKNYSEEYGINLLLRF